MWKPLQQVEVANYLFLYKLPWLLFSSPHLPKWILAKARALCSLAWKPRAAESGGEGLRFLFPAQAEPSPSPSPTPPVWAHLPPALTGWRVFSGF